MSNYRRFRHPGGTYFFTLALNDRRSTLLVDHIDTLRAAYAATLMTQPVRCDAIVILPNHLHAVWTLPAGDTDYSERWRKIKHRFSKAVGKTAHPTSVSPSKSAKRELGLWQRRFWEHTIRNPSDYRTHVDYCLGNPVRHGLVERPVDWPHSSIHREIARGHVSPDWTSGEIKGRFGEIL